VGWRGPGTESRCPASEWNRGGRLTRRLILALLVVVLAGLFAPAGRADDLLAVDSSSTDTAIEDSGGTDGPSDVSATAETAPESEPITTSEPQIASASEGTDSPDDATTASPEAQSADETTDPSVEPSGDEATTISTEAPPTDETTDTPLEAPTVEEPAAEETAPTDAPSALTEAPPTDEIAAPTEVPTTDETTPTTPVYASTTDQATTAPTEAPPAGDGPTTPPDPLPEPSPPELPVEPQAELSPPETAPEPLPDTRFPVIEAPLTWSNSPLAAAVPLPMERELVLLEDRCFPLLPVSAAGSVSIPNSGRPRAGASERARAETRSRARAADGGSAGVPLPNRSPVEQTLSGASSPPAAGPCGGGFGLCVEVRVAVPVLATFPIQSSVLLPHSLVVASRLERPG
jgi:hypothetical protein